MNRLANELYRLNVWKFYIPEYFPNYKTML